MAPKRNVKRYPTSRQETETKTLTMRIITIVPNGCIQRIHEQEEQDMHKSHQKRSFETTVVENSLEMPASFPSLRPQQRCCFFGTLQVAIKDKE
jgi:hypothetical protein